MEKRRSAAIAALLGVAMPGLGHLYCGRLLLAVLFWALSFLGWGAFLFGFGLGLFELGTAYPAMLISMLLVWAAAAVHAGLLARRTDAGYQLRSYNLWYFYLLVWLLGFAVPNWAMWRATRTHILATYPLLSDGMAPTLLSGDWVLVDRRGVTLEDLKVGTVVAALDPADAETVRILRVAGLASELVELTPEGLVRNGQAVESREVKPDTIRSKTAEGAWVDREVLLAEEKLGEADHLIYLDPDPTRRRTGRFQIPPGRVLLLGDNRTDTVDSTSFGPVPTDALLGRAVLVRRSWDPRTREWRRERKGIEIK